MRRWLAVPLFLATAVLTSLDDSTTPPAFAQKKDDKKDKDGSDIEPFLTPDGVELHGRFHRATSPKGPIVLLLYPPGGERTMDNQSGDWKGLAKRLNEEGYHVLRFDWRGHGKSTVIKEPARFWDVTKNPWTAPINNKYVRDTPKSKKPNKLDLSVKDIPNLPTYLPVLVEDLAGLRLQLDKKNDDNEKGVSSSSIYVIGAGEAAVLGLLWMRTEWDRPAVVPKQNQYVFGASDYTVVPQQLTTTDFDRAGETIAGAIWLSPALPRTIPLKTVEGWIATAPRMRDSNPMMFIWGEKDDDAKKLSKALFEKALVGDPKAATAAGLKVLDAKKSGYQVDKVALKGGFLLGDDNQYKTETKIIERLNELEKDRGKRPRATRGFDTRYYINLGQYGVLPP
jgi:pimeloyl-ACP methyl ester carboxylesterase